MKKNLYLKSCLMLLYALNFYLHPVYAQIEQGQFIEDDCRGFELESSRCMNTLNECFSCIMQRGLSFFDPEIPDGLILLEHKQIIHYQRASDKEALDYQLEVDVQEYNEVESKSSLVAKAMWLAGESRRSQNCLSDSIFYILSEEDFFNQGVFILWNKNKNIFFSLGVDALDDHFVQARDFKIIHVKYCLLQP